MLPKKLLLLRHPLKRLKLSKEAKARTRFGLSFLSFKLEKMLLQILKSKIHRVTVTEANLDYIGSITIDEALMEATNIYAGERVQVVDNTNGARLETYVITGKRGSGCICINGAAAHLMHVGDTVIIMAYALMTPDEAKNFKPAVVFPENNHVF